MLDVNNVYVSSKNHGFDPLSYLNALPFERVVQFHVAGHTDHGTHIIDSHIGPVIDPVWQLLAAAHQRSSGCAGATGMGRRDPELSGDSRRSLARARIHRSFGMNREATADALGLHERASATTPERVGAPREAALGSAPAWTEGKLDLRTQQKWFAAIVSTPQHEPAPVDEGSAARLITASATLSSLERIDIYRRGYHARLIECLVDDYPVLEHALGDGRVRGTLPSLHRAPSIQRPESQLFRPTHG